MAERSEEGGASDRGKRRRWKRRHVLGVGGAAALGMLLGARFSFPACLARGPVRRVRPGLASQAFEGLDAAKVWDTHVHLVGIGTGDTGCWVNPDLQSFWSPVEQLKFDVYMAAAGITDEAQADEQYFERLLALHEGANPRGKLVVMAFDLVVREDGTEDRDASNFHTPDEYVLRVAAEHDELVACASIHPYRADAIERLDRAFERGARAIKWLPNAMQIDPASERCDDFYARLAELGVPLITHTGEEQAVHSAEAQKLGNPLRLRRPLDAGVKVVAAHCASLGVDADLDAQEEERTTMDSFDLFMRLFTEPQYESTLFADISALVQFNRCGRPLEEMIVAEELHPRLVNGSDYPLPAIDPLVSTLVLESFGYLTAEERERANEVFEANPLLYDFVVKRSLKVEREGRTYRFSPRVFETSWLFG